MFRVAVGGYELTCQADGLPGMLAEYQRRAALSEVFDAADPIASWCYVGVGRPGAWPSLVVTQRYSPAGCGFHPGVLLVPETGRLFLGAGRRLLGYDLSGPTRLWEDEADVGFLSWDRHGRFVLMSAELELAAWDGDGRKLWSRFVEPPWEYRIEDSRIHLDVMGDVSWVDLADGSSSVPPVDLSK